MSFLYQTELNAKLERLWEELRVHPMFLHDSFEPVLATATFASWIWMFYLLDAYGGDWVARYRIHDDDLSKRHAAYWQGTSGKAGAAYLIPIVIFDCLVPRRKLPAAAPSWSGLWGQVLLSVFAYDFVFFFIHVGLHKAKSLRWIRHSKHHSMSPLIATEVLDHSFADGTLQVMTNVLVLNLLRSHPLARACHNVVITYLLTELHAGYDAPWMLHRVVPFGLMGGPNRHEVHHRSGAHNFQQFFTYLDNMFGLEDLSG